MLENDYRVIPNFVSTIICNNPISIYGDGTQTRTFCYITDAIVGFMSVLLDGVSPEAYNIGNPVPEITMLDLVKVFSNILGKKLPYNLIEHPSSYPKDEPIRRCPNIRKASIQLDYTPTVSLEEGLSRFLKWAQSYYKRPSK